MGHRWRALEHLSGGSICRNSGAAHVAIARKS